MNKVIVDCSGITDARQLHEALKEALRLPEWYGHNLDALYDCLTELCDETHLILLHWDRDAAYSAGFLSVFDDAHEESDCFAYTVV